jgi:hypothetical protein
MSAILFGQDSRQSQRYQNKRLKTSLVLIFYFFLFVGVSSLPPQTLAQSKSSPKVADDAVPICSMIEDAARDNALPLRFFARVIWQESGFQPDAVGPMTHSGARALGIAQFMPGTAAERGLIEPFDPAQALPKSGKFLADLRDEFGNLGLAAAAYNAGPQRVRDFLARTRDLPTETRNYVLAITGRSVEAWAKEGKSEANSEVSGPETNSAEMVCRYLETLLAERSGNVARSSRRMVPSWCEHLSHPNTSVCGSVHQIGLAKSSTTGTSKIRFSAVKAAAR